MNQSIHEQAFQSPASIGWLLIAALCSGCSGGGADSVNASTATSAGMSNGGAAGTGLQPGGGAGAGAASLPHGGTNSSAVGGGSGDAGVSGSASGNGATGGAKGGVGGSANTGGSAGAGGNAAASGSSGNTAGRGGTTGSGGAAGSPGTGGATNLPKTTIWLAGDSTVMTYAAGNTQGNNGTSLEGWGQEIGQFFGSQVTINNQAIGGRSVAFFMWSVATDSSGAYQCDSTGAPQFQMKNGAKVDTSQWAKIKSGIKAGDFLLIQFGTNDETHDCPRFVSTADFQTDLGFMTDTVTAKGATAIFVTPQGHRSFTGTKFNNTLLPYANAMKAEASVKVVEVEDLNLRSGEYYESVGTTYLASNIFDGGTTHFIKAGAVKIASLVVGEVRKNKGPLAAYLK